MSETIQLTENLLMITCGGRLSNVEAPFAIKTSGTPAPRSPSHHACCEKGSWTGMGKHSRRPQGISKLYLKTTLLRSILQGLIVHGCLMLSMHLGGEEPSRGWLSRRNAVYGSKLQEHISLLRISSLRLQKSKS